MAEKNGRSFSIVPIFQTGNLGLLSEYCKMKFISGKQIESASITAVHKNVIQKSSREFLIFLYFFTESPKKWNKIQLNRKRINAIILKTIVCRKNNKIFNKRLFSSNNKC